MVDFDAEWLTGTDCSCDCPFTCAEDDVAINHPEIDWEGSWHPSFVDENCSPHSAGLEQLEARSWLEFEEARMPVGGRAWPGGRPTPAPRSQATLVSSALASRAQAAGVGRARAWCSRYSRYAGCMPARLATSSMSSPSAL